MLVARLSDTAECDVIRVLLTRRTNAHPVASVSGMRAVETVAKLGELCATMPHSTP